MQSNKAVAATAAASFVKSRAHWQRGTRQVSQSTRHANFVIPGKRRKANRCQVLITHVMPARLGQSAKCAAQKFWTDKRAWGREDSVNCVTVVSLLSPLLLLPLPRADAFALVLQQELQGRFSDCCGACKYFS